MTNGDIVITSEDVRDLNKQSIARAAAFTRLTGIAVIGAGALGCAAWVWILVRTQQQLSDSVAFGFSDSGGENASWVDRVDLIMPTLSTLLLAALVVGFGLALRLVADFIVDRTGGSTTGFEPGDVLPEPIVELNLERDEPGSS